MFYPKLSEMGRKGTTFKQPDHISEDDFFSRKQFMDCVEKRKHRHFEKLIGKDGKKPEFDLISPNENPKLVEFVLRNYPDVHKKWMAHWL